MYFPYIDNLIGANHTLADDTSFILYPGMEYASYEKWWPDAGMRPTPHEGIDFCYHVDASGHERAVAPGLRIPVMAPGIIAAICKDYLGHTLFVDHGCARQRRFLSVYAHIVPDGGVEVGRRLSAGEVIAGVADTSGRKNRMPAHLHFTLMEVPENVALATFDWDLINRSKSSKLLDPLEMIDSEKIIRRGDNHWKKKVLGGSAEGL